MNLPANFKILPEHPEESKKIIFAFQVNNDLMGVIGSATLFL